MENAGATLKGVVITLFSLLLMTTDASAQEQQDSGTGQENLAPEKIREQQAWMDSATKQLTKKLSEKLAMQLARQLSVQLISEHMSEQVEDQLHNLKNTAITAQNETGHSLEEKKTPVIAAVISGQAE
ncbi:hypothetical protein [Thiolapillus sp.]